MERVLKAIKAGGLVLLACACMLVLAQTASAAGSANVVIIGGTTLDAACSNTQSAANVMYRSGGGCLPVNGTLYPELAGFTFTSLDPSLVNATALAPYDTAVLNVASYAMACNTGNLSAQAKTDLLAFVAAGKKLIIFDSECGPVDYSWMPFPFTTANPGAAGAHGTLTIVEENTLSSSDPTNIAYYIDAAALGSQTDAVGDMNVMTTYDANWCIDMSGTNIIPKTGPVHTYAKYPAHTDKGLIIYNGLDQDYQYAGYNNQWLRKIWALELSQPFNPSNLPCGYTIVGITLTPTSATNEIHTSHTLTASLADLLGQPKPGILVTISVVSGPNAGTSGSGTSDANGKVTFTYTGNTVGQDKIEACFIDEAGNKVCSQPATKDWVPPPNLPPDCSKATPSISQIWPPNHQLVPISILGVTDPEGDPLTITVTKITQDEPVNGLGDGDFAPDGFGVGSSAPLVRAERSGKGNGRVYVLSFTADDLKGGTCTGSASVCVPHDQGKKGRVCIDDGQGYDSTVTP